MEYRKHKRYIISAQVIFVWATPDGKLQCGRGITRDINTFGVYVLTDALPSARANIQMEISLPRLTNAGSGMQLTCEGVVVRCESDDAVKRGFAALAQNYHETAYVDLAQWNASRLLN